MRDPTADQALNNITRAERDKERRWKRDDDRDRRDKTRRDELGYRGDGDRL